MLEIESLLKRMNDIPKLRGMQDSRSAVGIFSRGANVYRGGSNAAHSGGGRQFGRPNKNAIQRRMKNKLG